MPKPKVIPIHKDDHYSILTQFKQASAGAGAGFITRTLTQPFDVLKIRFQLQVEPVHKSAPARSKYNSIFQACRLITREEGLLSLWKGHNAGQMLTLTYTIFQFWSYEQIDLKLRQDPYLDSNKNLRIFIAGGMAGCVGTTMSMPFDVIRTRVVGQDPHVKQRSIFSLFPYIVRKEGVVGLFRGLGTTLIQIGPLIGFNFMFYHNMNDVYARVMKPPDDVLPIYWLLLNGGFAGVVSKFIVYPLDFVKKRLQLQGFRDSRKTFGRSQVCTGIGDCMRQTLREEGYRGFYKGVAPTLLKSGFTTAFYFSIYDVFKRILLPNLHHD